MVQPSWLRQFETSRSEGVARARTPTRLGVPTGTIDERKTEREKEEEKRRGFSIPGFFGTALSFLGEVDKPISERLGLRIPEMRGPIDEIGNIILQEATRPTTALIGLGGIGLGARAGAAAGRLGARAAARKGVQQGATSALQRGLPARAALRTGQGALKAAQFASTPAFGARGISRPVRFAGEVAQVGGFRAAQEAMSEAIPEDAPGVFRIGAPILVGLGGGLAGLRGFESAARTLKINTDNRAGMEAVTRAVGKQNQSQLRKQDLKARRAQDKIAEAVYGKKWSDLTAAERRTIEGNRGDRVRLEKELEGTLEQRRAEGFIDQKTVDDVRKLITQGDRPMDEVSRTLRIRNIDDVRREAHIMDYAKNNIDNEEDLFILAKQIEAGKYRDASAGTTRRGQGRQPLRKWNDVPQYLSGKEDAMLSFNHYEGTKNSMERWLGKQMGILGEDMKNARAIDRNTGESKSLLEAFDESGRLNEFGQQHIVVEGNQYTFKEGAEEWEAVFDNITGKLDDMVDAEKRLGIDYKEIIGEDLIKFGPDELPADAYFGDIFERRGAGSHYFPRIMKQEAMAPGSARAQGLFGRPGYEKNRRYGFEFDEGDPSRNPSNSFIRLMADNEEAMAKKGRSYLGNPIEAIHMRLQAGANRVAAKQLSNDINLKGDTVLERLVGNKDWNASRKTLARVQRGRAKTLRALKGYERKFDDLKKKARGEEGEVRRVEGRYDRNRARMGRIEGQSAQKFLPELDQIVSDFEAIGRTRGGIRKSEMRVLGPLRQARNKLKRAVERGNTEPEELAKLIDEAEELFDKGSRVIANWSARAPRQRGTTKAAQGARATVLEGRADKGRALQQAQIRRFMARNDERFTRAVGRDDELTNRLDELINDLDENVPAEATLKRQIEAEQRTVDRDSERVKLAKRQYDQAKAQAGDVLEGEAIINDWSTGGRIFEEEYATQINKVLTENKDILPYIRTFNNFARAVNATMDLSAIGIQGLLSIGVDPIRAAKMIGMTTRALFDPTYYNAWVKANTKNIDEFISYGGYWSGLDDTGEFLFPTKLTEMRGVGFPVKLANHHFSRTGNALRLMMFERATANRGVLKHIFGENPMNQALGSEREMVETINSATGFRNKNPSEIESTLFFAPRFFRAQLDLASKAATKNTSDGRMAREMMMKTLTTAAALTWFLNDVQDKETDWNPIKYDAEGNPHYNSNFMRIKSPTGEDVSLLGTYDSLLGLILTGMTEGPASGAVRVFSTKASPALNIMADIITQETFQGDPVDVTSGDPRVLGMSAIRLAKGRLPFTMQSTIDLVEEGASLPEIATGTLANLTGIKSTPQTPREQRDLRAYAMFDKPWDELLKSQRNDLEAEYPEFEEQILDQLRKKAATGDLEAEARVQKAEIDEDRIEAERRLANAVASGEVDRGDLSKLYNEIQLKSTFEKRGKDIRNIEWATSDDPNKRALDEYYRIFDDEDVQLLGGDSRYLPINWDVVEEKREELFERVGPDAEAYIKDYTALNLEDHPEEIRGFLEARNYISKESGYWGQKSEAFERYRDAASRIAGQPIESFSELELFIRQNPGGASRALDGLRKRVESDTTKRRERLRRNDPQLDVFLVMAYGYKPVTAAGRRALESPSPASPNPTPAIR